MTAFSLLLVAYLVEQGQRAQLDRALRFIPKHRWVPVQGQRFFDAQNSSNAYWPLRFKPCVQRHLIP